MSQSQRANAGQMAVSGVSCRRFLLVARVVWLALAVPAIGLYLAGIPACFQQLQKEQFCGAADCLVGGLTKADLQTLAVHGIPVSVYAAALTAFFALITGVWFVAALLLFWRKSESWMVLLAALMLVMNGIGFAGAPVYALVLTFPILDLPVVVVQFLSNISLNLFLLFFPNGRLAPRWTGLSIPLLIVFDFVETFPSTGLHFDQTWAIGDLYFLIYLTLYGLIIFSQIYRYRRVSTLIERQQTRWVVFGILLALGTFVGLLFLSFFPWFLGLFANVGWDLLPVGCLALPLTIWFSIARYRLYDIDALINRALIYGSLTLALALVYLGLVVGLGSLVNLFPGDFGQSPALIVLATLSIAALFQPLRRWLQTLIDRRFYRNRYDAAKTLSAFSATLSQEVELAVLSERLVRIVSETMQPESVSLWLVNASHPTRNGAQEQRLLGS